MSPANPPSKFTYKRRRGAWCINEIQYPSGMNGCVMRSLINGLWHIVEDPRPFQSRPKFRTRLEAAQAEWQLAEQAKADYERTVEKWARAGISIHRIKPTRWIWTRISDASSPQSREPLPTEFMSFEYCVADLEATMKSGAKDAEIQALAEKELLKGHPGRYPFSVFFHAKIRLPHIWENAVRKAVAQREQAQFLTA